MLGSKNPKLERPVVGKPERSDDEALRVVVVDEEDAVGRDALDTCVEGELAGRVDVEIFWLVDSFFASLRSDWLSALGTLDDTCELGVGLNKAKRLEIPGMFFKCWGRFSADPPVDCKSFMASCITLE